MPARRKGRKRQRRPIDRVLVGWVPVFSRKLIIMDPACADSFVADRPSRTKRKRDFSFSGACAATRTRNRAAELMTEGAPAAIAAAVAENRNYPVYALVRKGSGRILRLVIVLDADPCREAPRPRRKKMEG